MTVGTGGCNTPEEVPITYITTDTSFSMSKLGIVTATLDNTSTATSQRINLVSTEFKGIVIKECKDGVYGRTGFANPITNDAFECKKYVINSTVNYLSISHLTPGDKYYVPVFFKGNGANYATFQSSLSGVYTVDASGTLVVTIPSGTEVYMYEETNSSITLYRVAYYIPV